MSTSEPSRIHRPSSSDPRYYARYRLDAHRGVGPRKVASADAAAHVRGLLAAGWSAEALGEAAGVSVATVRRLQAGEWPNVNRLISAAVLVVTPDTLMRRARPAGPVPAAGARRRMQALAVLGWPQRRISEIAGVDPRGVGRVRTLSVTRSTHDAVAAVYRQLSTQAGPSRSSAIRAAARGWFPPAAWDDAPGPHFIDDPAAVPSLPADPQLRPAADVIAEVLLVGDEPLHVAAARIGVGQAALIGALERHRPDLLARLKAASARWRDGARMAS